MDTRKDSEFRVSSQVDVAEVEPEAEANAGRRCPRLAGGGGDLGSGMASNGDEFADDAGAGGTDARGVLSGVFGRPSGVSGRRRRGAVGGLERAAGGGSDRAPVFD